MQCFPIHVLVTVVGMATVSTPSANVILALEQKTALLVMLLPVALRVFDSPFAVEDTIACPDFCSGKGMCKGGRCVCRIGHGGANCVNGATPSFMRLVVVYSQAPCAVVHTANCPSSCSAHGSCQSPNNQYTPDVRCQCKSGFLNHACGKGKPCSPSPSA